MRSPVNLLANLACRVSSVWKERRWHGDVDRIQRQVNEWQALDSSRLCERYLSLRYQSHCGESAERLRVPLLALATLAVQRGLGLSPYPVQILGAIALHAGHVAEMQTGEGKTLTAALAAAALAVTGGGVHVATANDYLASRDADLNRRAFRELGLSVDAILQSTSRRDRFRGYQADITYSTARELGFDFLRDRLLLRNLRERRFAEDSSTDDSRVEERPVQRLLSAAIVDEADSLLIDEARVPLIISAPLSGATHQPAVFDWAAALAFHFTADTDFLYDPTVHEVQLTPAGRARIRESVSPQVAALTTHELFEAVERAIRVDRENIRDRHFVIRDGKIVIVDEFSGRLAEGRQWRGGIHQAVEAKEGLPITPATAPVARITVQDYFTRYRHLCGMTGTIGTASHEFREFYKRETVVIPTHRTGCRDVWPTRIFKDLDTKELGVLAEVLEVHALGRPVLIGTRSIDRSERLAELFKKQGVPFEILHARRLSAEAEIVARAGQSGTVTISTNMAGRGTDIELGPGVAEIGGLHVIGTELHESTRIDRQLFGRCARQGDPGSARQFVALDDDLLSQSANGDALRERCARLLQRGPAGEEKIAAELQHLQSQIEARHFRDRQRLVHQNAVRRRQMQPLGYDPFLDIVDE